AIGDAPYPLTLGGHGFYWFALGQAPRREAVARTRAYEPPAIECASLRSLCAGDDRAALEEILPGFFRSRHWFRGRARAVAQTTVIEALPIPDGRDGGNPDPALCLALVLVEYGEGEPETYGLP